jgi:3-oxoacyl-[acyl-carrier protein] reductase
MLQQGGFQVQNLANKRALVCGASQGIGHACAVELASQGASVTIVARNEDNLKAAAGNLPGDGPHRWIAADFGQPDALREKVSAHVAEFGPFTILVNNTGGPPHGPIVDATPDQFLGAISNHIVCNQHLVQTLLPGMKDAKYGRIINIISTSVIMPIRGLGVSNTTRGAVANWGRTLAGELAPFGITVNNVLPGFTDTARLTSLFDAKAKSLGTTPEQVRKNVVASIPMERMGEPSEIGAVVAFLASPGASYLSGVNLPVDGARTAIQ